MGLGKRKMDGRNNAESWTGNHPQTKGKTQKRYLTPLIILLFTAGLGAGELVNLAGQAKVSASSEYKGIYGACWAIDGMVPEALSRTDRKRAWRVRGADGLHGEFSLVWPKPVEVAEIVYFGCTGRLMEDCFKDYEVYLDDDATPVKKGVFKMRHGPQRISISKRTVKKVRIKFLSAFPGALNPGASEIAVFGASASDKQLADMLLEPDDRIPDSQSLRRDMLAGKMGFRDILLVKRHAMNISHVYVYHVEGYQTGGGLYVYTPDENGGQFRCIVDSSEGMICTADLSYDGKEVVFAWKRGGLKLCKPLEMLDDVDRSVPDNNYQIYTVNIDGTGLKRLTDGASNNLDPSWLPDGGIVFISDRKPAYAYCYMVTSPVIYRMDRDGGNQKRLSANYLMDFTPSVLNDGRIIYTRWEYVDRGVCPIQSLWTLNPDGTGLAGFYGNRVIAPGTFMDAQPVPGTTYVIATATNHNGPCRGGIVLIDPSKGANAKEAVTNLTPEVDIYEHSSVFGNGLRGPYEKPFPIGQGRYLVTSNGRLQLRNFDGDKVTLLSPDKGLGYYSAQPIVATKRPPLIAGAPMDHTATFAKDGSVSGAWATVFLRDVYDGLEPDVKRGQIKQIAVVQEIEKSTHSPLVNVRPDGDKDRRIIAAFGWQFPLVSCGATCAPKRLWGFADVAEDGSAAFRVPAEVPIYFMALDAEGRALQRMRSFTHMMPGEVQGCVGCHADRNSAVPRMGRRTLSKANVQELTPPKWGVTGFRYDQVVQPVLDKHCIKCHNERKQPSGVDLSGDKTDFFSVSYDILARKGTQGERDFYKHSSPVGPDGDAVRGTNPYTSWIWTINGAGHNVLEIQPRRWGSPASKLAKIIRSGHPDKNGEPRVDLADAERRNIYMWIDLNVPYYGTSSSNYKERLGCRRMYPYELDKVLKEVASRRCRQCHTKNIPRKYYTRMLKPENNSFMLAPLAKSAGGTEKCGRAIFESKDDADYRKIMEVFDPIQKMLEQLPRADMVGFESAGRKCR